MIGLSLHERNKLRATHGHSRGDNGRPTGTYTVWVNMVQRCTNPNHNSYHRYGGRGIKVCDRWLESFENFLNDMGEAPEKNQLDRENVDGNYEKDNCRWVTPLVNANNRANNRLIEFEGETRTVAEWSREFGIGQKTIAHRLKYGWTVEKALTTPATRGRNQYGVTQ